MSAVGAAPVDVHEGWPSRGRSADGPGDEPCDDPLARLASRRRGGMPRGSHRARALCEALGSPHLAVPAIHVSGSDGKTSVVRIVVALLEALGVATGDTTSPHLQEPGERIRLAGRSLPAARLSAACDPMPAAMAVAERRLGGPVTFFDAVTAVALRAFADAEVQVAVVEAGIGGGGDATSVVRAGVAVLAPIRLDHPELGATHAEVAAETADIVPPGGTLVTARQVPAATGVLARVAAERGATLRRAGRDFGVLARRPGPGGQRLTLRGLDGSRLTARLPLHGAHQADNAALALAAVQAHLGTSDLDPGRLRAGLAAVAVPGRLEIVRRHHAATVVLDGAHEPAAVRALVVALRELGPPDRRAVVLGVSGDRDPGPLLAPLRALGVGPVVVTAAGSPTATPAARVAARLRDGGAPAPIVGEDPATALDLATRRVGAGGQVVVTGSLHLVGDARTALALPPA